METKESIKWATLGDTGTKFFHANATTRHRRNYITSFRSKNGDIITSHPGMESLIWDTFKQRIGQTDFRGTLFDLSSLIQRHDNLDSLEKQFTSAKIDKVVKQLSNDKAPGPNGFSNEFIKKCWNHIKSDLYDLCWAFQDNNVCLQSINSSFITLVPRIQSSSCL